MVFRTFPIAAVMLLSSHQALSYDLSEDAQLRTNRYTVNDLQPRFEQENILWAIVHETLPKQIESIGDAIDHLLKTSGYQIADQVEESGSQYFLFSLPLPEVLRILGPMPLMRVLELFGGEGFEVIADPVKRTIAYQLSDAYRGRLSKEETQRAVYLWLGRTSEKVARHQEELERLSLSHPKNALNESHVVSQYGNSLKGPWQSLPKTASENRVYGPVSRGETLFTIALALTKGSDITPNQMMMAIFDHNPQSFLHKNINYLIEGSRLSIPKGSVIRRMSKSAATEQVWRHHTTKIKNTHSQRLPKEG